MEAATLSDISRNSKYGFLAATEFEGLGYCGGLLILTVGGRPVEFHCTAPVVANRAQQILYGATLKQFLICDQIGNALLNEARVKLDIVVTDQVELCELSSSFDFPFAFTSCDDEKPAEIGVTRELDGDSFQILGSGVEHAEALLRLFTETLPLLEPFERIYQAIGEARSDAA